MLQEHSRSLVDLSEQMNAAHTSHQAALGEIKMVLKSQGKSPEPTRDAGILGPGTGGTGASRSTPSIAQSIIENCKSK